MASFDEQNPFKPSYLCLVSQTVPAANQNRRRFVHSLAALDSQVIVNGGWTLPMGEEDSVRNLIAASRALPAIGFHTVEGSGGQASAPVRDPASLLTPDFGQGDVHAPSGNENPPPGGEPSPAGHLPRGPRTTAAIISMRSTTRRFPPRARIHIDASPACRLEEAQRRAHYRAAAGRRQRRPFLGNRAGAVRPGRRAALGGRATFSNPQGNLVRAPSKRIWRRKSAAWRTGGRIAEPAAVGRGGQFGIRGPRGPARRNPRLDRYRVRRRLLRPVGQDPKNTTGSSRSRSRAPARWSRC